MPLTVAIESMARTPPLPPQMWRPPVRCPLSRLSGATPTRAAIWRRSSVPQFRQLPDQRGGDDRPDAGNRAQDRGLGLGDRIAGDRLAQDLINLLDLLGQPVQMLLQPGPHAGWGRGAAVALTGLDLPPIAGGGPATRPLPGSWHQAGVAPPAASAPRTTPASAHPGHRSWPACRWSGQSGAPATG